MKFLATAAMAAALALTAVGATAGTQFLAYEGRNAIQVGEGGNKKVVDGVDFWMFGSPPHRFQVLGMLQDERWRSGLYGLVRVSNLEHDIAKSVREADGDAVIVQDQHDKDWGVAGSSFGGGSWSGNGWGGSWSGSSFSMAHPYGTKDSLYVVVKYLPDEPAGPPSAPSAHPAAVPNLQSSAQAQMAQAPPPQATEPPQARPCGTVQQPDGALMLVPCQR